MKKGKRAKKKSLILLIIIIVLVGVGLAFFGNKIYEEYTLKKIKNSYGSNVLVRSDSNIYDKNHNKIGNIKKGVHLKLKNVKLDNTDDKYFEVDNGDFYVYYKDIKVSDKYEKFENKYLVFNKNIEKDNIDFYQNKKKVLTLKNKVSLPIEYMDDNYYYVNYMDNLFQIKKGKNDKVVDKENTKEQEVEIVSVLKYDVGDCSECISEDKLKEQLNYIKDNKYNVLTQDEYLNWTHSNIRLKSNYLVLTTDNLTDGIKNINKEYSFKIEKSKDGITYKNENKPSSRSEYYRYSITNDTSLDVFKQMLEGKEIYTKLATSIPVLNYHFFFDSSLGESCDESICLEVSKFRQHLDYLRDNGFKTLTMKEFKEWMYGERELPEKSVLITIDDGAKGTGKHNGNKLIPLLEEYKMHATLFLIAGWWNIENYASPYLDVQSHTYDMHQYGTCGKGQLVCANYEQAKADLKRSLDIVGDNTSFCYPFYSYSDTAIQAVKDLGFKVAFAGGSRDATRNDNKYIIPRYPIHSNITMDVFKRIVN